MTSARPRCSDDARLRGDAMEGTAAPARAWLLIEHHGPWPVDAFAGSGIHEAIRQRLLTAAAQAGARVLLVRRPGRQDRRVPRSWAVVDGGGQVWGTWPSEEDLLGAVPHLARDRHTGSRAERPVPLLLVCAHGRHDLCCAVRGRPVAAALQARWPEQTWECSHVGGDRFAANLVVLPDGVYYGGLDPATAVSVVQSHLAGRLATPYLRGLSREAPAAQAAVIAAHRSLGPAGVTDFVSRSVEVVGERRWRVLLSGPGPLPVHLEALVECRIGAPARLTCRASADASPRTYVVISLRSA